MDQTFSGGRGSLRGGVYELFHIVDGGAQACEDGSADDGVADVEFADFREVGDGFDIMVVQGVACVEAHGSGDDALAHVADFCEFVGELGAGEVASGLGEGVGVGAGVDFADGKAGIGCGVDLIRGGVDEGGDEHACIGEAGDDLFEAGLL